MTLKNTIIIIIIIIATTGFGPGLLESTVCVSGKKALDIQTLKCCLVHEHIDKAA